MEAFAVEGIPEVTEGDDIAELIEDSTNLREGDVICVASTIVSKTEGRAFAYEDFPAGPRAKEIAARLEEISGQEKDPRFAQAVLEESVELAMEAPFLLTETRFGHVGVNAGIDRSNTGGADLLLLPKHPSKSAERIRMNLNVECPVIVTDTCGRPFRYGQRGVAIGWAGIPASRDWRGETDRDGYELEVTVESIVDELAATANVVTGEGGGGTPVAIIRNFDFGDHEGSQNLFRDLRSDFVRQALRRWSYEQ
ncbi:MAG: coenzyme F420-0:L-glutamate ligase [Halobacteriaceae archaeon]